MKKKTPEQVRRLIERDVRRITGAEPESDEYVFGCIMVAASLVGISIAKIARLLRRSRSDVAERVSTLRQRGIFQGRKIVCEDWFAKGGGLGFNIDIAIAMGLIERVE